MSSWEYLIIALPPFEAAKTTQGQSRAVDILNEQGAAGWEAVGVTELDGKVAVLLKRPTVAG